MQIITTAIIKGGTGKTTTAAALAQAATAAGKKVLCIDLDPQANFTFFIGADQNQRGSYHLLHGENPAALIQHTGHPAAHHGYSGKPRPCSRKDSHRERKPAI